MSCDHELANEWARCSGKNASYITTIFVTGSSLTYQWDTERSSSKYIINHVINEAINYVIKLKTTERKINYVTENDSKNLHLKSEKVHKFLNLINTAYGLYVLKAFHRKVFDLGVIFLPTRNRQVWYNPSRRLVQKAVIFKSIFASWLP